MLTTDARFYMQLYVCLRQKVAHSVDIVKHLLQHYGQAVQNVHTEEAPGVAMLARIYKRWQRRSSLSDTVEFRRGLAHLVLLSSPGTGKTTVLHGLLLWLREFLEQEEAQALDFIAWAMYSGPFSAILPEGADLVCEFLGALRRTAGPPHHLAMLWAQQDANADVERDWGITAEHGPALRLLYACLCPQSSNPPIKYSRFIEQMDVNVRQRVSVKHVLDFMRTALGVPEGELFLLLVLVDGGNHAEGAWEHNGKPNQELTWLQQSLSKLVSTNGSAGPSSRSLVVPLTATTQWRSSL
ncbi:g9383 [Coccomyxa elongata]